MIYGRGKKQKIIVRLGKEDKLTFGNFLDLFGYKKSLDEIEQLEELGLISIDEDSMDNNEFTRNTRIRWNANE